MLERATREDPMLDRQIAGMVGQPLARSEANGDQIDETRAPVTRTDEKREAISRRLNGVAYRRDIKNLMPRAQIEKSVADIECEVANLRKVGWGLVVVRRVGAVGLLVKAGMAAAHIAT